jgi:hypothetical protein
MYLHTRRCPVSRVFHVISDNVEHCQMSVKFDFACQAVLLSQCQDYLSDAIYRANQCVMIGLTSHVCVRRVYFQEGGLMSNDHGQSCNPLAETDAEHCAISANVAMQRPEPQQDTKQDFASMWIQRAMAISRQMHGNEDLRREVAKRIF